MNVMPNNTAAAMIPIVRTFFIVLFAILFTSFQGCPLEVFREQSKLVDYSCPLYIRIILRCANVKYDINNATI
jgi:hypothetical protein